MKSISELRSEIESRSASAVAETNFGTDLVGRLLSLEEVDAVAGGFFGGYVQEGPSYSQQSPYSMGTGSYSQSYT